MKSKPHFIDHDIIIHFSGYMYFANLSFKKLFSGNHWNQRVLTVKSSERCKKNLYLKAYF